MIRVKLLQSVTDICGRRIDIGTLCMAGVQTETTYTLFDDQEKVLAFNVPTSHVTVKPTFITADGINFTETHPTHDK